MAPERNPSPPTAASPTAASPTPGKAGAPLPPAERRRRVRELWLIGLLVAVLAALLLQQPLGGLVEGVGDSGLFLFLNTFTVILILIFGFLVTRNFWKLVGERRRGILGSHLNLKFVAAFVLIALVTTSGLFVVSAFFITQSLDKWFSVQVDRALEESGEVAASYYQSTAEGALFYARRIAERIAAEQLAREDNRAALEEFVRARQREYNLGVVEVFGASGQELVSAVNPEIPAANFSHRDSDLVRSAMDGGASWRVEEVGSGDVIRGAVPIAAADGSGEPVGAVVVNHLIPFSQARKVASIQATLDEHRRLQPRAGQIRGAYVLALLLAFLVELVLAIWIGFRLAKGVTGPIRELAQGTAEVARGNLDVSVPANSEDEVGFLVQSFNHMIRDLREARTGIERSATELERRRRYMEVVLGNIGAGVVSLDGERRISTINPSAQRYLGIPAGTGLLGQTIADVATRPELIEVIEELSGQLQPGLRESIRRQVQVPVGVEQATLFVTLTAMHDEAGDPIGTVVVFDDYTQLVKVQRLAAWREVARRIAHEIRNPLTPIQLSAQRMRRRFRDRLSDGDPGEIKVFDECVDAITSQVESLKLLVDEFSNFARLPSAQPRPDDLNRIVSEVLASYAGNDDVEFVTDLAENLPTVEVDREQMRRALTNLIDNAVAAVRQSGRGAGEAGHIRLRSVHDAALQSVRLEVADDGEGIPPADRRRVFEPYFSTKDRGTGLGLAIVSRIVADHRGYVRVQQNEPRGTRFVIELPVRGA